MIKKLFQLVLILAVVIIALFSWWNNSSSPADPANKESYIFVIPKGMGAGDIAKKLKNADLIKDIVAFKLILARRGISNKIQAGDYRLSPSMNLSEITQTLTHGTTDIWATIPEGLRKEEIAVKIANAFSEYNSEFDANAFLAEVKNLEGYLFPDTYLFPKDASPSAVIKILANTFELKYQSLKLKSNLTKKELITLASIIEREAKYDEDRPIIAGILIKRLENDWPLQVDAAVQYAKANSQFSILNSQFDEFNWWPVVDSGDLKEIDSTYNTYLNKGLPPTPICNPGLDSLKAAANPQDSEYWFYLADDSGKTYYSETIEEHEEKIGKYLD